MPVATAVRRPTVPDTSVEEIWVTYIGKCLNYVFSRKPTKDDPPGTSKALRFRSERANGVPLKVLPSEWKHLKNQRGTDGMRLFIRVYPGEEGMSDDREAIETDRVTSRPGDFVTKKAAISYAADTHNVQLSATTSLEELNEQTALLHDRSKGGIRGQDLIDSMRNAVLIVDDSDVVDADVSESRETDDESDITIPPDEDEDDTPAPRSRPRSIATDAEGEIDTAGRGAPSGRTSVRKPGITAARG